MSDLQPDLNDPAVREQLGLEERTEGGPPEPAPQPQQGALKHVREALEQQTKAKIEAEAEAAQLRRDLAIERSALPDFPGKSFFIENYRGEATPEAIRAAAETAGFVLDTPTEGAAAPDGEGVPRVTQEELAAHRAVATVGAGSSGGGDIDLNTALLGAKSAKEILAIVEEAQGLPGSNMRSAPTIL